MATSGILDISQEWEHAIIYSVTVDILRDLLARYDRRPYAGARETVTLILAQIIEILD